MNIKAKSFLNRNDIAETQPVLNDFSFIKVLKSSTSIYKIYWKSLEDGMWVGEYNIKHKALLEIERLIGKIL